MTHSKHIPTIIALHCTGATGRQWRGLEAEASGRARILAPDLIGPVAGGDAASLLRASQQVTDLLDAVEEPVHLVGHSYGGALALRAALERPHAIASLTLYEPSAFGLLKHMDGLGQAAFEEIKNVASRVETLVRAARQEEAMGVFTDYWQGPGSWSALPPDMQKLFAAGADRVPQDFNALFADAMRPDEIRQLAMRCLIIAGDKSPLPARLVAQHVALTMPRAHLIELAGAGHMGPVTHRALVAALIAKEIGISTLATAA